MIELWRAAQNSCDGLFVFLDPKQQLKKRNSDMNGSALGAKPPTQAPKKEGGYRVAVPK